MFFNKSKRKINIIFMVAQFMSYYWQEINVLDHHKNYMEIIAACCTSDMHQPSN